MCSTPASGTFSKQIRSIPKTVLMNKLCRVSDCFVKSIFVDSDSLTNGDIYVVMERKWRRQGADGGAAKAKVVCVEK